MIDSSIYYQGFMSALQNKIPNRIILTSTITDILAIDKDAVYRRLRGEVNFSFAEMATIAKRLGISLDNIVGIETMQSRPSQVNITRHVNPTEVDYSMFENFINFLKSIKDEPNTKLMEFANMFPNFLFYDYEHITRLILYRWNRASNFGRLVPFNKIIIPERLRTLQKECCLYARHIKSTLYVFEFMIFQRLVTNIKFFAKVHIINEEEVSLIKNDLTALLNNLEKLATTGKYEDTGNEVSIYISDISLDSNYCVIGSKHLHINLVTIYLLNAIVALDEDVFNETSSWIHALQRGSTLISVTDEKIRAAFFKKQREVINTL